MRTGLSVGLFVLCGGCSAPTQIELKLTTDVLCDDLAGISIRTGTLGRVVEAASTKSCDPASGTIGTVIVVPSDETDAELAVEVVASVGPAAADCKGGEPGCIVARRALRFIPHTTLHLPVALRVDCEGVPCGATATCAGGSCKPATIDDASRCASPDGCSDLELYGCPGTAGPAMVRVGGYCVDSTEVSNAQYAEFLAAKGGHTSGQISVCAWNEDFTPGPTPASWPVTDDKLNHPVVYVDWCDAYAYCGWAKKRLCGRVGGGHGSMSDYNNVPVSQWMMACTAGGTRTYPYGDTYDPVACNSGEVVGDASTPVGSLPGCEGGYPGVFDMSGNVSEWVDECNGQNGAGDSCMIRGGSYLAVCETLVGAGAVSCTVPCAAVDPGRSSRWSNIGFRCCAP